VHAEDLTTTADRPVFDERTREYLRRVRAAGLATLTPWRTRRCPECGDLVTGDGLVTGGAEGEFAHVVIGGAVVLGCEGFFVVDPAALGMDPGQWQDWRGSPWPGWREEPGIPRFGAGDYCDG
jgi:hypothetical protein